MTKRLQIERRRSEVRTRLNEIRELSEADHTDAVRTETSDLEKELRESEAKLRDAITDEERELALRGNQAGNGAGESAEVRAMIAAADLGAIFDAVLEHRQTAGRESELQKHFGLGSNQVPLALLVERRNVTPAPANVGQTQAEIIPGVFPSSVSAFLGVDMPRVPSGEAVYPVLTTNAAVEALAENAEGTETTGSFAAEVLAPSRLQASFFYSREDGARFRGMADALRMNLVDALADALDKQVIAGTNGLLTGANLTDHVAGAADTFSSYRKRFAFDAIDGTYASVADDLRLVVGASTYAHMATQYRGNNADDSVLDSLMRVTSGVRVSAHVPVVAATKQNGIVRRGMRRDVVAPIWDNLVLIPDEVTKAAHGQIVLTAILLYAGSRFFAGPVSARWRRKSRSPFGGGGFPGPLERSGYMVPRRVSPKRRRGVFARASLRQQHFGGTRERKTIR